MSNFTPLKFEKGKGVKSKDKNIFSKKFFLIGNLILVVLIAIIGGVYYYNNLISTKQRAVGPGECMCKDNKGNPAGLGTCNGKECKCPAGLSVRNNRCGETLPPEIQNKQCSEIDNVTECNTSCSPIKQHNGKSYACKWIGNSCTESSKTCEEKKEDLIENAKNVTDCQNAGGIWCSGVDYFKKNYNFCITQKNNCKNEALKRGYVFSYCVMDDFNSSSSPTLIPCESFVRCENDIFKKFKCSFEDYNKVKVCDDRTPNVEISYDSDVPNCFCGIIQIDSANRNLSCFNHMSFFSKCGCENDDFEIEIPSVFPTIPIPSITITITPTRTPTPTTPPNQPTNTPTPTNPNAPTPTPTEIIVVRATNTPGPSSTSTPIQQILQTGNVKSSWIFAVPIAIILLGLLL
ncbi:MAG: hypothetical protein N2593_01880 [Patescibacteria group bacterium]|nr:hypothetical protein [Patescibacteria group bacterium]